MSIRDSIIDILRDSKDGATGAQIDLRLPWWNRFGGLYAALFGLESEGLVESEWLPGPYPRSRIYRLRKPS